MRYVVSICVLGYTLVDGANSDILGKFIVVNPVPVSQYVPLVVNMTITFPMITSSTMVHSTGMKLNGVLANCELLNVENVIVFPCITNSLLEKTSINHHDIALAAHSAVPVTVYLRTLVPS